MKKMKYAVLVLALGITMCGFSCNKSTKNLAVASDAVAHALGNAQTGISQAVASGVMTQADANAFNAQLGKVSTAGIDLDSAIRNNESASGISAKVNVFLDAFNALQSQGVVGIKDKTTQLTISTIITGAEASIAVIAAEVGK